MLPMLPPKSYASQELRIDGQGDNLIDLSSPSNTDGKITETKTWDVNSRLIAVQDDNLNTTVYEYDSLNRQIKTIFADTKFTEKKYSSDHNITEYTDNNGTICTYTYDGTNRLITKDILTSTTNNIEGTTQQTFQYDGLSRLIRAIDNNDPNDSQDDSEVTRNYDSLSRMLEEQQNGKTVSMEWREQDDLTAYIYPNDRKVTYSYDEIDRTTAISEDGETTPIASYDYIGTRLIERVYKNGTKLTMLNDAGDTNEGYDDVSRLIKMRHLTSSNQLIQGYEYGYNRVNFQNHKKNLKTQKFSELYKLDSLYRVVDFKRGELATGNATITGDIIQSQNWEIDGVGNWAKTNINGEEKTQTTNEMNEYEDFNGLAFTHDDNGNLTDDGEFTYKYDALNRITKIHRKSDSTQVAMYKYDYMNRRIQKDFQKQIAGAANTTNGEHITDANTLFLYHFNNQNGPIVDSSVNANDIANLANSSRTDGLFNSRSLRVNGQELSVPLSSTLDNYQNQITVEAYIYLDPLTLQQEENLGGKVISREQSFTLEISKVSKKPAFQIYTLNQTGGVVKTRVPANTEIPLNTWVHLVGVYDGQSVKIFVNGIEQHQAETVTGNLNIAPSTNIKLGNQNLFGHIEETRISNIARSGSGYVQGTIVHKDIRRGFFYSGWRVVEERQQIADAGQTLGTEVISRQFVDGIGIDEHLQITSYDTTGSSIESEHYLHENHRSDTVAVTDENGNVVHLFEYTSYGEIFEDNEVNELEEFSDFDSPVYGFQGRRIDVETNGIYYFRNRYYNTRFGHFLQRDPLGYIDSVRFVLSKPL